MAGYIFNLDNLDSLELYLKNGIYATIFNSAPKGLWRPHHEGTFADYSTMKPGDSVYFFIDRKIYGIGELIEINSDCKYFNFPDAYEPSSFDYSNTRKLMLWDEGDFSVNQRCLCFFKPSPHFFKLGVDMDDLLSSNPQAFKMIRAFSALSFIKFDEVENQAFKDIILKRNQDVLISRDASKLFVYNPNYKNLKNRISDEYRFSHGIKQILSAASRGDSIAHEMAIEMGLLYNLANKTPNISKVFGNWDYMSHQVIASPFKPIFYMDKIDVFGYSFIAGHEPTKSKYFIVEIKKGEAQKEDVDQLLKYVDWVKDEYCYGDYSMIRAFLLTYSFSQDVIKHKFNIAKRQYTTGMRPTITSQWDDTQLVKYSYDSQTQSLNFNKV